MRIEKIDKLICNSIEADHVLKICVDEYERGPRLPLVYIDNIYRYLARLATRCYYNQRHG